MESMRMFFKLITISFQGRMQFRGDFFAGIIGVLVYNAAQLGGIAVILSRFISLAGWTIWDIVFLYSLWMLGHSIFSLLFWHLDELEYYIIQGTFDQFLIRPLSPLLQFLGREVNYVGVGDVLVGLVGLIFALQNLSLNFSAWHWLFLVLVILSGTLIEFSITLSLTSVAFWTGHSARSIDTVMQFNFFTQQYPIEMFGKLFRIFVTFVVPFAFINYYPARLLLGKLTPGDPLNILSYISPLVAILLLGIAMVVWSRGLKAYNSSGA